MKYPTLFLLISLMIGLLLWPFSASAGDVRVITHTQGQYQSMSHQGIRAIFSMRLRNWPDGSSIQVFVLNDDAPLHNSFAKTVLGVFPHQLRLGWDRLVFSGTGQAPIEVESLALMKQKVAETPGSIGYIASDQIDDSVKPMEIK